MKRSLKNTTIAVLAFVALSSLTNRLCAQSGTWRFGFELGWSYSNINGESESSDAGIDLETANYNSGFNLSIYTRRYFTDLFGLQFGVAYSQRGSQHEFDGQSYYIFGLQDNQPRVVRGSRFESRKYANHYIDLPVMVFHHIGSVLEVGAGGYASLLVSSKSDGEIRFNDEGSGISFQPFFLDTEYNYLSDDYGDNASGTQMIRIEGQNFEEPRRIPAYYEYLDDPGEKLLSRLDYGLMAHLGFYFNESLNVKGRVMYGLADLTNEEADVAKSEFTEDRKLIFRDDTDNSVSFQVTLGFLF